MFQTGCRTPIGLRDVEDRSPGAVHPPPTDRTSAANSELRSPVLFGVQNYGRLTSTGVTSFRLRLFPNLAPWMQSATACRWWSTDFQGALARFVRAGIAVLQGWYPWPDRVLSVVDH